MVSLVLLGISFSSFFKVSIRSVASLACLML